MKRINNLICTGLVAFVLSGCGSDSDGGSAGSSTSSGSTPTTDNTNTNTGGNINTGGNTNTGTTTVNAPAVQSVRGAMILSFPAVDNATSYRVYHSTSSIAEDSPNTGSQSVVCNSSPCYVPGLENGVTRNFRVEALNVTTPVSISAEVAAIPGGINDTGVNYCASGVASELSCEGTVGSAANQLLSRQDGMLGRDTDSSLVKVGTGRKGFDFTKLDEAGQPLSNDAADWACIRDNVTGLIWENKSASGATVNTDFQSAAALRDWQKSYSFDNTSLNLENGLVADVRFSGSAQDYIATVNTTAEGICGFTSGWRLPTLHEFAEIIDYGTQVNPSGATLLVDQNFFRSMGFFYSNYLDGSYSAKYWTGTVNPHATYQGADSNHTTDGNVIKAWVIDLKNGQLEAQPKGGLVQASLGDTCVSSATGSCVMTGNFIRLVRDGN